MHNERLRVLLHTYHIKIEAITYILIANTVSHSWLHRLDSVILMRRTNSPTMIITSPFVLYASSSTLNRPIAPHLSL